MKFCGFSEYINFIGINVAQVKCSFFTSYWFQNEPILHVRAVASRGAGGALAPQFLAKQLTLFQPGGQNIPATVLRAPPEFQTLRRACQVRLRSYLRRSPWTLCAVVLDMPQNYHWSLFPSKNCISFHVANLHVHITKTGMLTWKVICNICIIYA